MMVLSLKKSFKNITIGGLPSGTHLVSKEWQVLDLHLSQITGLCQALLIEVNLTIKSVFPFRYNMFSTVKKEYIK